MAMRQYFDKQLNNRGVSSQDLLRSAATSLFRNTTTAKSLLKYLSVSLLVSISLLLLPIIHAQVIIPEPTLNCNLQEDAEKARFCEQEKLDTLQNNVEHLHRAILTLLDESIAFYDAKYSDAFYDNYEMPYQAVKETFVKSQVLWEQFTNSHCELIYQMASRGTSRYSLQLQCLQNYYTARIKTLQNYWQEIDLDTTALLELNHAS